VQFRRDSTNLTFFAQRPPRGAIGSTAATPSVALFQVA
jgi:hypothetical protein